MTEFGFIENIASLFSSIPTGAMEGIGDDCAVIPTSEHESLITTTDMLVERVHFLREAISPYALGRKSLTVNLSDIAAMGGKPIATLLSLALPKELSGEWVEEFMRGYHSLSAEHGVALIGGDTCASTALLTINVTAIGRVENKNIKHRTDARVGDYIVVSGELGGSGAGLKDILSGKYNTAAAQLHNAPTARIKEGEWLGGRAEVNAMMDISDGIASDLKHILKRSGVGATIALEQIPTSTDVITAISAGEDYELLLTAHADNIETLLADYHAHFGTHLHPIGRIIEGKGIIWLHEGTPQDIDTMGFSHF